MSSTQILRGPALCPEPDGHITLIDDALIELTAHGHIDAVVAAPDDCEVPITHPGTVWMPGLVDTHIHFPQTHIIGSAAGPLLDWLETVVFPEEARFAEIEYAARVAEVFCDALIAQGTTCAAIYGSSHIAACDTLFQALATRGLKAIAGPALMNRGAPDDVLLDTDAALAGLEALRQTWHGHDNRLWLSVVPRFALSCTQDLLSRAGRFALDHGLWVQTHLSENKAEIAATAEAFPNARDYLGVYEDAGLVHERSIFAHCIWLDEGQWHRMASVGASVTHCPDSNFFLGSGCMHLETVLGHGVPVGLGTDVGAGRTFSVRRVVASAYDAALMVGAEVSPERLLWLATLGGAQSLNMGDHMGRIAPGYDADLIAVPVSPRTSNPDTRKAALIDALVFQHDTGPVTATYVRGQRLR
ncbi:MAG: guanine deaminase [Bradymonadia bacterium]